MINYAKIIKIFVVIESDRQSEHKKRYTKNFIFSIDKADLKDGGEGAILIRLKSL